MVISYLPVNVDAFKLSDSCQVAVPSLSHGLYILVHEIRTRQRFGKNSV
jgi:hypothetical protein